MMNIRTTVLVAAMLFAGSSAVRAAGLKAVRVYQVSSGVYEVVDPNDGTAVYVSDPAGYIRYKYPPLQGFGGRLSPAQFTQGVSTTQEITQTASTAINSTAAAGYNILNQAPGWRKITSPVSSFLHRLASKR